MAREWSLRLPKWIRHRLRMAGAKSPETIVEKTATNVAREWALRLPKWIRCRLSPFYIRMARGLEPPRLSSKVCLPLLSSKSREVMKICCALKHEASLSDTCCSSLPIFAVMVAVTRRDKKIPCSCPWGLVVDICCLHCHCCCRCHESLVHSLWGYRHRHIICCYQCRN